jgi:hypothetical protein
MPDASVACWPRSTLCLLMEVLVRCAKRLLVSLPSYLTVEKRAKPAHAHARLSLFTGDPTQGGRGGRQGDLVGTCRRSEGGKTSRERRAAGQT